MGVVSRRNFPPTVEQTVHGAHTRPDSVSTMFYFPGREADYSHSSVVQLRMCIYLNTLLIYVSHLKRRLQLPSVNGAKSFVRRCCFPPYMVSPLPVYLTDGYKTHTFKSIISYFAYLTSLDDYFSYMSIANSVPLLVMLSHKVVGFRRFDSLCTSLCSTQEQFTFRIQEINIACLL